MRKHSETGKELIRETREVTFTSPHVPNFEVTETITTWFEVDGENYILEDDAAWAKHDSAMEKLRTERQRRRKSRSSVAIEDMVAGFRHL